MNVLIIGGVAGGMSAATRLRRMDENAQITVLERGEHVSFANCGLPYYAGGVIKDRSQLLLQTPASLKERFNIDVHTGTEALSIDRAAKTVHTNNGDFAYDKLILAPGAQPFLPPIPGIERALTLRNVADVDLLVNHLDRNPQHAVVLGGGFIGLELAENLHQRGLDVTIVEAAPQILAPLDEEMAAIVTNHLEAQGVKVIIGDQATAIGETTVTLASGTELPAAIVIAAVGVRPDTAIASAAGLDTNERGAIIVDKQQRTNDPDIFAVGDAVVKTDRIDGSSVQIPLANSANRDGRLVADVITGRDVTAAPVLGTAIVGVMGLTVAATGWNERRARAAGRDIAVLHTHPFNHATYYPGAAQLAMKLVYDRNTLEILGGQVIGTDGVDKRIDVIATAIVGHLTADQLADIDLAYAPQFGSAKDAITMLGFVADNAHSGLSETVDIFHMGDMPIVDVRTPGEVANGAIEGSINIPLDELRERISEVPAGPVLVHCAVGVRGHTAVRILKAHGIEAYNLGGGFKTWNAWHTWKANHGA